MKAIQDAAAFLFEAAVAVLTAVCVLGVWDFFTHDVIYKSFETVGLLAIVAVIVILAGHFITTSAAAAAPALPNPGFPVVRKITLTVLIIASVLLAFVGVLSIWNVITDHDVLDKAIGSLSILSFGAFVITITCLERESNPVLKNQGVGVGGVVLALVFLYLAFAFSGLF